MNKTFATILTSALAFCVTSAIGGEALAVPGDAFTVCGNATAETQVCASMFIGQIVQVTLNTSDDRAHSYTPTASASQTVPGAFAYTGVVDLSDLASFGFNSTTSVSLVTWTDRQGHRFGRLDYLTVDGWTAWPGSGVFAMNSFR
jgi:hypothetical protein